MNRPVTFDRELLACRPRLLGFAMKLAKNQTFAEDLVQEAATKAMLKWEQFQPGTSMFSWLSTIVFHEFATIVRRGSREVADPDGISASILPTPAGQAAAYDLKILFGYMERLSFEQRACLELRALDGRPYEEVAEILGIPVGTVKSQVSRARSYLAEMCGGRP